MENTRNTSIYRVWAGDKVMGETVDLPGLIQWIRDEKVTGNQWIYSDSNDRWSKAADLPELQAIFRTAPQGARAGGPKGNRSHRSLGVKPETLRRMKCFAGMDDRQIETFIRHMEVVHCQQFRHIVSKGEESQAMYLVMEGELRALAMVDGKEVTLGTIHAGESFGEISLIDQDPRSAHVIANKDSVLLKVSPVTFEKLPHEAPALPVTFLLSLSRSVVGRMRSLIRNYEDSVRFIRAIQKAR